MKTMLTIITTQGFGLQKELPRLLNSTFIASMSNWIFIIEVTLQYVQKFKISNLSIM